MFADAVTPESYLFANSMQVSDVREMREEWDGDIRCETCKVVLADNETICDALYCESCFLIRVRELMNEAKADAKALCVVYVDRIEPYDPSLEFRCTPEEYAAGARESYTPNSYWAHLRHNRTNYDQILPPKDGSVESRILYDAIRERMHALLEPYLELAAAGYEPAQGDEEAEVEVAQKEWEEGDPL